MGMTFSGNYIQMPGSLHSALEAGLGTDITQSLVTYWPLMTMGCIIFGIITVIHAMRSIYNSYRYNNHSYRRGALLKFVAGIGLVNVNWVILAMVQFI